MIIRYSREILAVSSFITTIVKLTGEDKWGKLKRALKYLKGTNYMKPKFRVESMDIVRWWIDASYNNHEDCRYHFDIVMILGWGAVIISPPKIS